MNDAEKQILATIDAERDALVDFYQRLVQVPSVWGDGPPLQDAARLIAEPLEAAGFDVELQDPGTPDMYMVAGTRAGDSSRQSLMFNGHMEVYPPSNSWSMDPFGGTIADGKLYGQGAADMKAGTAAGTMASALLARHLDASQGGDLKILIIPNHFEGGEGTRKGLREGFTADQVINCEPTDINVVTGQRGILYLNITTRGRSAHTTATDIGVNAIERMAKVIDALGKMEARDSEGKPVTAEKFVNVAEIKGGLAHNLIPEACELTVDIRFPPEQTQDDVLRDVKEAIAAALPDDEFETTVEPEATCVRNPRSSMNLPHSHPLAQALAAAHSDATGREAAFSFHPAWPDTPIFNEMGVPAITYGPGSMQCYWDDEYVVLDEYIDAIRTYCIAGLRLLSASR